MNRKIVINPDYIFNNMESANVVLTPTMENVYLLGDVETIITNAFASPITIVEALYTIKEQFDASSFNESECLDFINKLLSSNILMYAND